MATFNGAYIFGLACKVTGPLSGGYRRQEETFPGVSGKRVYRLGANSLMWTIRGRLVDSTLAGIKQQTADAIAYVDGRVYDFVDSDGTYYQNCLLNAWAPVGPPAACSAGFTQEVTATVECIA